MYRNYFQKSKVFLYPLLGIEKGVDFVPVETYLSWEGNFSTKDKKFICLYDQKPNKAWAKFENDYLFSNILFFDYMPLENNVHVYIFDLSSYASDYNSLVQGKYSNLTESTKDTIMNFFGEKGAIARYVEEYLYPDYYFDQYAEELGVSKSQLEEVGELCSRPDLDKEHLIYKKPDKAIIFKNKMLSLWSNSKYILK